jgi:outer membrane protein OmpA-like peptidoglycan-associated protein
MKRVLTIGPVAVLVAACAGGPHAAPSYPAPASPPPPLRTATTAPVRHPPAAPREIAPPPRVASAGPLKTAMISGYMDQQESDLRQRLRAYGIAIARRGDGMLLNINNAVLFDGMQISATGSNLLGSLALVLRHYDHTAVTVSGYTDTTGAPDQNMAVSEKRAQLVFAALARDGVATARLSAQGFGENNPRIKTGPSTAEARNRRIEIRITATPAG